jgi:hypothetical protein
MIFSSSFFTLLFLSQITALVSFLFWHGLSLLDPKPHRRRVRPSFLNGLTKPCSCVLTLHGTSPLLMKDPNDYRVEQALFSGVKQDTALSTLLLLSGEGFGSRSDDFATFGSGFITL